MDETVMYGDGEIHVRHITVNSNVRRKMNTMRHTRHK